MNIPNVMQSEDALWKGADNHEPGAAALRFYAPNAPSQNLAIPSPEGTAASGSPMETTIMPENLDNEIAALKEKLLLMATHAEAAVNGALKALIRRDDELARQTREDDSIIDQLEVEIDEAAIQLLAGQLSLPTLRLITTAMKIAHDLERVGDEATTISRRCMALSREPQLQQAGDIPHMGQLTTNMLRDSLDAFVNRDVALAQGIIPRDKEVDAINQIMQRQLTAHMARHPETIERCLNLMVISKSLERIADHATNVAEMVVFLCEGRDIRHASSETPGTAPT